MTAPLIITEPLTTPRASLRPGPCSPLVAALCVAGNSVYHSLPGVECYDPARDVRTFDGGMPVVAHPPCRSWSAFCAHQAKPPVGEKELGPLCVEWLRTCGGVLEHPAHSRLFDHCGLPKPGHATRGEIWTMEVWQAWWGYSMMKKTWLCFCGVSPNAVHLPFRLHPQGVDRRRQQLMSKNQRAETCRELAEWLVAISRTANVEAIRPATNTPTNETK